MSETELMVRTVEEELGALAHAAYELVQAKGLTPTAAAEEVVRADTISDAAILYALQRTVGRLLSTMMTRALRTARNGNGDRRERIDGAVKAMERTLSFALDVLAAHKAGADGVERPLREFTIGDHSFRADIEASIEAGAAARAAWHRSVVNILRRNKAATINELPLSKQYELARELQKNG